jgi:hypothetical protein
MIKITVSAISIIMALTIHAKAYAEVISWNWGEEIQCPVELSTADKSRSRFVHLPGTEISYVHQVWDDQAADIQAYKNGVIVIVRSPTFDHKVMVYDNKGGFYALHVFIADDGAPIDNLLKVEDTAAKREERMASSANTSAASDDNEALSLMIHMRGGDQNPGVTDSADVEIDEKTGQRRPYRLIYESDAMRIISVRIYRSTRLMGYQCIMTWKGEGSHRVNLQNLAIDGAICVSSTKQDILDQKNPSVPITAKDPMVFWYVCDPDVKR